MSWFRHLFLPHESNNQRAKLLHPSSFGLIIGFFTLVQIAINYVSSSYPAILGYASQIPPAEIVRLTNVNRESQGLPALKLDSELTQAAVLKAADMFARDYWAHVSPIGTLPWYFFTEVGYSYRYAGENLARDFSNPGSIVQAWVDSPTHRENLLSSKYQDIGVAVVDGQLSGRDTTLVVQLLGTRLSAVPAVSRQASFTVQAQEEPAASAPAVAVMQVQVPPQSIFSATPVANPFDITRAISLSLLAVIATVLLVDVVLVRRGQIIRWTSRSPAHLIFISVLLVAAFTVLQGQIL
ncbi:hypothetical protein A2634_05125 [Candidatus Amesbacteria bacterium RIFCSPHIGHO2_01_FULL_48_32]|uniref:SCP domain-containing protein n=1 Tax=Candidatus Amesbacteria bacterium RIFCSPLOWO2_01_FULL_48_25 TaxID=1797259 RepID=A0A1F4ZCI6_9BACT|nr:MAG: hypothetical protein A2634_05125 [Candidatus Amesbacteria bacterium RIFCSPHIGHO2_01_FULL_48_32]OGD04050.1 MAG: hypothetical protein A2989_01470 [Candidatus Amesbacteria bacterium RIFCSPLOWO2_01_FULL_48_25]HJZ05686.1 CAP domain-containing protein [Patescibacteria group bacterium]